jgi:hypothetical protein
VVDGFTADGVTLAVNWSGAAVAAPDATRKYAATTARASRLHLIVDLVNRF